MRIDRIVFLAAGVMVIAVSTGCSIFDSTRPNDSDFVADSAAAKTIQILVSGPSDRLPFAFDTVSLTALVFDYRGKIVSTDSVRWSGPSELVVTTSKRTARLALANDSMEVTATFFPTSTSALVTKKKIVTERAPNRLFVWTETAGMQILPPLPHIASMKPLDVNDAGQVTGSAVTSSGAHESFVWSREAGFKVIESFVSPSSTQARAINASGNVVGWTNESGFMWSAQRHMEGIGPYGLYVAPLGLNTASIITGSAANRAFRWGAGIGMLYLPVPPDTRCSAGTGINDSNQIAGFLSTADRDGCFPSALVMWDADGHRTEIFTCGGTDCDVATVGINNRSEVAGYRNGSSFKWTKANGFVDLTGYRTYARDINNAGDVVGGLLNPDSVPFIWRADGTLVTLALPNGMSVAEATAINNSGMVVGWIR